MKFIGKRIPRIEDRRLLTGNGKYTDDIKVPEACSAYFIRSPYAHARIRKIETAAAGKKPGVLAILTGEDYRTDGHKFIKHQVNSPDAVDITRLSFVASADSPIFEQGQPVFAEDRVRFVGELVAIVVAVTLNQARDAAEDVQIEYEELPAVITATDAIEEAAPRIWDTVARNICFDQEFGDRVSARAALSSANYVVRKRFKYQRIAACQMEPRAAIGIFDKNSGIYTLIAGSQGAVRHRVCLAGALGVGKDKVRVITHDVGGGFGARNSLNPEAVAVCWASRRVGRAVHWLGDRSEAFLSDYQGRDLIADVGMALNKDGKILSIEAEYFGNLGAHTVSFVPLANGFRLISTVYDVPLAWVHIQAVLTNTVPVTPYRGAGRPEATFMIERLLDIASQRYGFDRALLRKKNLVIKTMLPYRNVMGLTYDSGEFSSNMERAMRVAEWETFPKRQEASSSMGRLRGIGLANYVESPVGAVHEKIMVSIDSSGKVEIASGTQSTGQGHETVFAQVIGECLGIDMKHIRLITGDTGIIEVGGGTHSDRTMRLGGKLMVDACADIVRQGTILAAQMFGCEPNDVHFGDGFFSVVGSNESLSLTDVVQHSDTQKLTASAEINKRIPAHPTGCAVCELEVDPETGAVQIVGYTSIDDVGQAINPMIVDGQVCGGIVMGVGEALSECFSLDTKSGQVTSGSFMDYAISHATLLPRLKIQLTEDPTATNPLRVKGGGECGITPAAAVVINALVDALKVYGIEHIDMPATPNNVWKAIQSALTSNNVTRT